MNKWAQASPVITSRQLTAIIVNNNCCHTQRQWSLAEAVASHLISAGSDARLLLFPEVLRPQSRGSLPTTLQVDLWPPEPGPVRGSQASAPAGTPDPIAGKPAPPITPDTPVTFDELHLPAWCLCSDLRKYSQEEDSVGGSTLGECWRTVLYALCLKKKKRGEMGVLSLPRLGELLLYHNYFCPITELGSFCLQRLDYESALWWLSAEFVLFNVAPGRLLGLRRRKGGKETNTGTIKT